MSDPENDPEDDPEAAGRRRRILVIYDTSGGGHHSHAKAIRDRFTVRFPGCEVTLMHASAEARSPAVTYGYSCYNWMLTLSPTSCPQRPLACQHHRFRAVLRPQPLLSPS